MPGKCISAKEFEESVHLALRVVESSGTGPAVRPAVDGAVAVLVDDPALSNSRVALVAAVRQVIRNGLALLDVSSPQSM